MIFMCVSVPIIMQLCVFEIAVLGKIREEEGGGERGDGGGGEQDGKGRRGGLWGEQKTKMVKVLMTRKLLNAKTLDGDIKRH